MFTDSVKSTLTLTIKGQRYAIAGGNIKVCRLDMNTGGYRGELTFWLSDELGSDKLTGAFVSEQLIKIELSLQQYTYSKTLLGDALTLTGLVGSRSVREQQYIDVKDRKICFRQYRCEFTDAAQFIWRQHFPCELYVDKTFKQVICAQQVDGIDIEFNWPPLEEVKPMICLSQGATGGSFYDFLTDYLARNRAFWWYDYSKNSYVISEEKSKLGDTLSFLPHQIQHLELTYPTTDIKSQNLLNGHSEQAKITTVKQNPLLQGIKNDRLIVTPFAKTVEAQKTLQSQLCEPKQPQLTFTLNLFPLKPVFPGAGLKLNHGLWSKESLFYQKPYRVIECHLDLSAVEQEPQHDLNGSFTQYNSQYYCRFEEQTDNSGGTTSLPPKPCFVEGVIVSEPGEKNDKTYQYQQNENTKQLEYRIHIPLWEQEINLLFKPDFLPPHFYFPLYKGCRVELQMNLFEARICRVLDWGERVFFEQDTQGNHLLMGKNAKDETSIRHVYEDNKPVLSIKRVKDNDTELVKLQDGKITFQTQEE